MELSTKIESEKIMDAVIGVYIPIATCCTKDLCCLQDLCCPKDSCCSQTLCCEGGTDEESELVKIVFSHFQLLFLFSSSKESHITETKTAKGMCWTASVRIRSGPNVHQVKRQLYEERRLSEKLPPHRVYG